MAGRRRRPVYRQLARLRTSANAARASSTTSFGWIWVSLPPRLRMRPSTMTVSTFSGCVASTTRCTGSDADRHVERVGCDHDHVRAFARRERADLLVDADDARGIDGRQFQRATRGQLELAARAPVLNRHGEFQHCEQIDVAGKRARCRRQGRPARPRS